MSDSLVHCGRNLLQSCSFPEHSLSFFFSLLHDLHILFSDIQLQPALFHINASIITEQSENTNEIS